MPLFIYTCPKCNKDEKRIVLFKDSDKQLCKSCSEPLVKNVGKPSATFNETADEYRNKSVAQDAGKKVEERAKEHFRRVELPRIIEKEGIEYAKRRGWVDPEGNIK